MDASPLCPSPIELRLDRVVPTPDLLVVHASACRHTVRCPACGHAAQRIHSRYSRTLADLPWHGLRVRLELRVRRFFCDKPACCRRIFTERLPVTTAAYSRRTRRAATALEAIGFAVGGRPGARLAALLGLAGGAAAILARVHDAGELASPTPRVLGVDDWALRRGQRYGTILLDLERHAVIDLLPDREAATFAAWLRAHPGVELISRDRGGMYADGARDGAPDAVQIADRFHLVRNLMEAFEAACARHHAVLRRVATDLYGDRSSTDEGRRRRYSGLPRNRPGPASGERRRLERRARRQARYDEVITLDRAGRSASAIARIVGLDRQTVQRWLASDGFPERAATRRQPHALDPFAAFIRERYDAGLENAAALRRELQAQGFTGSYQAVRRFLAELRRTHPRAAGPGAADPPHDGHAHMLEQAEVASAPMPARTRRPSPRQTAWLLRKLDTEADALNPEDRTYAEAVCRSSPELLGVRGLVHSFVDLLARRDADALGPWLTTADTSELRSFAHGVRRDYDAVLAAVLFQWSNGQTEGQVLRLKLLKRTMYGRAGFALLRKRFLHAA